MHRQLQFLPSCNNLSSKDLLPRLIFATSEYVLQENWQLLFSVSSERADDILLPDENLDE